MSAPRAFVSHASEDKERFVLGFAEKLRERGIDAWLDRWEMLPGDSLIDKIFSEGIKGAAAVIIVVSHASIEKPWVKEELNAAAVRHIENGTKLIPVVIDTCEVPEPLRTKLWEKIDDLSNYASNLDRIVAAILGQSLKPPLGARPEYLRSSLPSIPGLTHTDNYVLKQSCEHALKKSGGYMSPDDVFFRDSIWTVPKEEVIESLKILDYAGHVKVSATISSPVSHYLVSRIGFETYAEAYIDDFDSIKLRAAAAIVNDGLKSNEDLAKVLVVPRFLVDQIIGGFEARGFLQVSKTISSLIHIYEVSPMMKRWLNQ